MELFTIIMAKALITKTIEKMKNKKLSKQI